MKWIKVKDHPPPTGERVLVYQKGGVYGGCEIDIDYTEKWECADCPEPNNRIIWSGQGIGNYIHHWMPLPEFPEDV
jgi:hypothetical protein